MRFGKLALVTSAVVLGACAGGEKSAAKTDSTTAAPAAAPAAPAVAPATGGAAMAPVTGKTIEVKMVGDAKGYRFEPNAITLKAGDAIKFVNVIGFPHNIGFDPTTVPADIQTQLAANMPGEHTLGALEGPLMMNPNETYVVSFANIKPGTYAFHCTPHLALGMKGTITVQ